MPRPWSRDVFITNDENYEPPIDKQTVKRRYDADDDGVALDLNVEPIKTKKQVVKRGKGKSKTAGADPVQEQGIS